MRRISFCIICMNRLHHLKQTLLRNIEDNSGYDALEIVVLDYNSQDGMEEWVKDNVKDYISSGRVIYYKTKEPKRFSHSHSKNLAFNLASGEIVCNINADNYAGYQFAHYINQAFTSKSDIVLTPVVAYNSGMDDFASKDVMGKVCVRKDHFLKINGFDERISKYGYEDIDFINRLELANVNRQLLSNEPFLKYIAHSDEERLIAGDVVDNIKFVYIRYCEPAVSHLIILYKDSSFEMGLLMDNGSVDTHLIKYAYTTRRDFRFSFTRSGNWIKGKWTDSSNGIIQFYPGKALPFILTKSEWQGNSLLTDKLYSVFHMLYNSLLINQIAGFMYLMNGRDIMEENMNSGRIKVNNCGFGKATVFKNFNYDMPIRIGKNE